MDGRISGASTTPLKDALLPVEISPISFRVASMVVDRATEVEDRARVDRSTVRDAVVRSEANIFLHDRLSATFSPKVSNTPTLPKHVRDVVARQLKDAQDSGGR